MTTPDLAALAALVEALASYVEPVPQNLLVIHQRWQCLVESLPAAREALERMTEGVTAIHADETGHLHRCLFLRSGAPPRWSCVEGCAVQRAEKAEARLAALRGTT